MLMSFRIRWCAGPV